MSLKIDRVQLEIEIKTDTTRQKMMQLEDQMRNCRKELKKLDEGSTSYAQKAEELRSYQTEYDGLVEKIGVAGLSVTELKKRQQELNAIVNKLPGDSPLYKQYKNQLDEINLRMKELKGTATQTEFSLSKLADGFNRYAAIGAGLIASLTGVALTARKCVDEFAEMEESQSQMRKYTGLTTQEVKDINEEFKRMDTRTARTKLNEIAGDAGKIGAAGKKDIENFVEAANMIGVALGDDLGKDAVLNIAKLAQVFGEDKNKGLRGAMLATGSAVNAVGQNSSAAEGYLVGFTARVAGSAQQAKIAQTSLIGYASVLDQNMQQEEMAATAFQTLMLKMYQEPAKFAKMAGKNISEFTTLIKSDANEAILQFLESLNSKGGLDKLAPMFKNMGLDGVRASGVISTMAGKVNDIRAAQDLANKSYQEGTSIIKEYNIQNSTVEAEIEKRKKQFADIRIELGEKLLPAMKYVISGGSMTVKMLNTMVSMFLKYGSTIASLVLIIGTYTTAVKLNTIWQKNYSIAVVKWFVIEQMKAYWIKISTAATLLQVAATGYLTGATRVANLAMKEFFVMLGLNPIGLIIASVVALTTAMYFLSQKTDMAKIAKENLNRVYQEAIEKTDEEKNRINALLAIIHSETAAYSEKQKAIIDLKKIVPEYNAILSKTGKITSENTAAVNEYIAALLRKNKLEGLKDNLEELYGDKFKQERKVKENRDDYNLKKKRQNSGTMAPVVGMSAVDVSSNYLEKEEEKLDAINKKIKLIRNSYKNAIIEKNKVEKPVNTKTEDENAKRIAAEERKRKEEEERKRKEEEEQKKKEKGNPWESDTRNAEASYKKELVELKKNAIDRGQTENEYQTSAIAAEQSFYNKKLDIIENYKSKTKDKKHLSELNKMEAEAKDKLIDLDKSAEKNRLDVLTEYKNKRIQKVDDTYEKEKQKLLHQQADGEITEDIYNVKIQALDTLNKEYRLSILQDYLDDVNGMEFANGEDRAKAVESANKAVIDADIAAATQRAKNLQTIQNLIKDFKSKNGLNSELDDKKAQLAALKVFYDSQVILLKENGQDTTELTKLYNEARLKIEQDTESKILDIKSQYGIDVSAQRYKLELDQLKKAHDQGLLSDNEYEEAKSKLADKKLKERLEKDQKYFDAVSQLSNNFSSIFSNLQDAEVTKVESKYDKQIKAAKANGKDTATLEAKKEEEINQVKKKYADLQFASAILQITTDTAVGIMSVWANWGWNPIIAGILSGIVGATGISQLAVAKANRDAAKGLKEGGYSDEYVQGFTKSGNSDDVAGSIPVHKNEFVANHEAVQNPSVRRFLDVFNVAQKNGTIRMLNTTQILEQVRTRSGKYSGGYSSTKEDTASASSNNGVTSVNLNSDKVSELIDLMRRSNQYLEVIKEKPLYIDPRDVKKALKKVDQLEANVSRSS
jgi:phage tail tape measure protein, TP901 family, core region